MPIKYIRRQVAIIRANSSPSHLHVTKHDTIFLPKNPRKRTSRDTPMRDKETKFVRNFRLLDKADYRFRERCSQAFRRPVWLFMASRSDLLYQRHFETTPPLDEVPTFPRCVKWRGGWSPPAHSAWFDRGGPHFLSKHMTNDKGGVISLSKSIVRSNLIGCKTLAGPKK